MESNVEGRSEEGKGSYTGRNGDYFSQQESTSTPSRLNTHSRRVQQESIRPRLGSIQSPTSPSTPRTPRTPYLGRSLSSNFNSPGLPFRTDDEFFVFEFSSRFLRGGLGGESQPRCELGFGPETQTRAGDYNRWLSSARAPRERRHETLEMWGSDHVLWRMDLRDLNLGLVADKVERALRTAISEYLLVMDDSKKRKVVLAVPPAMPHPLLSLLLTAFFNLFPPPPSVLLLSSPVLCTIGAGLRSALVVDIGWSGTLVSAVCEYREVKHKRSSRAMKLLSWEVRNLLNSELDKSSPEGGKPDPVSFEETEEVLNRMVWCRKRRNLEENITQSDVDASITSIPLQTRKAPQTLSIPFIKLSEPVESALLAAEEPASAQDDDELALPVLLYSTLLSLPIDVRQACLSRIIITGGGSNIPGLKSRLLEELSQVISLRGWDPVHNYGSAHKPGPRRTILKSNGATQVNEQWMAEVKKGATHVNKDIDQQSTTPVHEQPPLPDPVLANIRAKATSNRASGLSAELSSAKSRPQAGDTAIPVGPVRKPRGIQTLGTWSSASLVAGLRVRGVVEVDREKFMQHGLSSGMKTADLKRQSVQQSQTQRQSLAGLAAPGGAGKGVEKESGTWTLGAWT